MIHDVFLLFTINHIMRIVGTQEGGRKKKKNTPTLGGGVFVTATR